MLALGWRGSEALCFDTRCNLSGGRGFVGTGLRVLEARCFISVAKGVRVGFDGVDLGRGGVVLLKLADVENVMHICAAGGIRKVQLKGIVRCLFEDHKWDCKLWRQRSARKGRQRRASVSLSARDRQRESRIHGGVYSRSHGKSH